MVFLVYLPVQAEAPGKPPPSALPWSYRPLRSPTPPPRSNSLPEQQFIDAFLNAKIQENGLAASPPASRSTLLRRVTFDLLGLPPTPEEVARFASDPSPHAFERVVDRLLASPHYGERWGRHWMDVVRYADTAGDNADYPIPEIYRYRDYIIESFNQDKPYPRFVEEQLAGDVLARTAATGTERESAIVATGFLALSRRYGTGPYELWHLTLENTLETIGQTFLGLNLKCARCHDHKSDPLSMRDYYGLYGIFDSTEFPWAGSEEVQSKQFNRQKFVSLESDAATKSKTDRWLTQLESLRQQVRALESTNLPAKLLDETTKKNLAELKKSLRNLEKPGIPPDLKSAYAVREGTPKDAALQKRGDPAQSDGTVPRCVPQAFALESPWSVPAGSSGRLELARWLTHPQHPLTARVLVNRIWHYHFGQGLVNTPNNLGASSSPPSHPELLDRLAERFMESGWSIKSLHRWILLSAAYQRSSEAHPGSLAIDPGNRWLWRFPRRRLEAEPLRDALLHVSGLWSRSMPGAHPFPTPEKWTWTQHTPFKERYDHSHRSVYLMTQRLQKHPFLGLFDGPDPNSSTESRQVSTVPQQALFALNHDFLEHCARALALRVRRERDSDAERLARLQSLAWSRPPDSAERQRLEHWLREGRRAAPATGAEPHGATAELEVWTSLAKAMLNANEFLYVD